MLQECNKYLAEKVLPEKMTEEYYARMRREQEEASALDKRRGQEEEEGDDKRASKKAKLMRAGGKMGAAGLSDSMKRKKGDGAQERRHRAMELLCLYSPDSSLCAI